MSERPDSQSGHLIERAAARLKAAKAATVGDSNVAIRLPPPDAGRSMPEDTPPPPLPETRVAGFKPLVIPPPSLIPAASSPPDIVVPPPGPQAAITVSPASPPTVPELPPPAAVPVLQPLPTGLTPPLPAPPPSVPFAEAVPEGVAGPIPEPAAPLTRPVRSTRLPGLPPALSINGSPLSMRPAAAGNPLSVSSAGARLAPGPMLPAPPVIQLDALERAGMVVARTTRTRISEEYRIAIGRILRTLHEAAEVPGARNVLMVTSARPGEGKSFTALNLAGSIAQNGTDAVLLVDVDPKVKPLSDQLGLGDAHGFLDLVSDPSLRPEDLLHVTAIPNLAVMPVGTRLGGAAQTIGGTASMRPIIPTVTRLARRFPKHLIMLDAPPCLSTSDPHTLAPHVGQIVLVVEAERTQRSEVEAAVDLVRVCPTITMLLNKVRMTTSHTFGAYDYFGSYT